MCATISTSPARSSIVTQAMRPSAENCGVKAVPSSRDFSSVVAEALMDPSASLELRPRHWLVEVLYREHRASRHFGRAALKRLAMLDAIYNRRILELAGDIPRLGRLASPDATARA